LVAQAHVVEMEYGEGTPPLSFFKNITINFDIHQKGEPLDDSGLPAPSRP
jgi:hypothetical protein